jgi:FHA domain
VLGRSHHTGDINFFSLGPAKALSRQHCVVDYRCGGKLVTPKSAPRDSLQEETLQYEKSDDQQDTRGAFVLEALGKNLIMVGSQRIRQGEVAILTSGTPIRMNAY